MPRSSSRQPSARRNSQPKYQEPSSSQPQASTWPTISFLFNVNSLPVNEEPSNGGVAPRTDPYGRWVPPIYKAGFGGQSLGTLYRWQNGIVSPATGYTYNSDNGTWRSSLHGVPTFYRANTIFYCNPFDQFLAAEGDASTVDIADAPFPNDRWYTLNFHHTYTLSRLDLGGTEPHLAGNGPRFIEQLGIGAWRHPDPPEAPAPTSTGLSGNLALLIGLVVFSCRSERMDAVLRNAWRNYQWVGHNHSHGRREKRGVVVRIYHDPQNPTHSNEQTLRELEWSSGQLLL